MTPWPTKPLKHVADIRISNVDKTTVDGERAVLLCNYIDVYKNDTIDSRLSYMHATATADQARGFQLISGDTVLTKDSETADDIAVPAYVSETVPDLVCGYHLAVVRPRRGVIPRYLYWVLASTLFRERMAAAATGVTRYGLRRESIGTFAVPIPPIEEQRRIADFLDAETTTIKQALDLRAQQLDRIKERYANAMTELVTPGQMEVDRRNPAWPWLPAELRVVRLGYLARIQTGVTVDASRPSSANDLEVPYLRVANVQGERIDISELKYIRLPVALAKRSMLRPGDVVMTEANGNPDNLGRGAVWDGSVPNLVHQNHIFAVRTDRRRLLPEYLAVVLASLHGRRYFRSTANQVGIATTSSSKILSMPIPVQSIARQGQTVDASMDLREASASAQAALRQQVALLVERRQALIIAAVTGSIDASTAARST